MSDVVMGVIYKVLSSPLRKLEKDLQAAASAHGFLDATRTASPFPAPRREQGRACDRGTNAAPCAPRESSPSSVKSREKGRRASLANEFTINCHTSGLWCLSSPSAAGACAIVGAFALVLGSSFAYLLIPILVAVLILLALYWVLAWAFLELTVRRCVKKLFELLAHLQSQHRTAREIVR